MKTRFSDAWFIAYVTGWSDTEIRFETGGLALYVLSVKDVFPAGWQAPKLGEAFAMRRDYAGKVDRVTALERAPEEPAELQPEPSK